jgi:hypothetical protein
MNRKIKITIEELGVEFTTDSPLKAYAFTTAILDHRIDIGLANEIAELCHLIYVESKVHLDIMQVVNYVCENYEILPDDFNDLFDLVVSWS